MSRTQITPCWWRAQIIYYRWSVCWRGNSRTTPGRPALILSWEPHTAVS